eukprot:Hpha_TRINITY_DN16545_c6_g1::TRINITY_DN16545_c6_g1_i1::g.133131::m.133131
MCCLLGSEATWLSTHYTPRTFPTPPGLCNVLWALRGFPAPRLSSEDQNLVLLQQPQDPATVLKDGQVLSLRLWRRGRVWVPLHENWFLTAKTLLLARPQKPR